MDAPRPTPAYRLVLTLGLAGFLSGLIIVVFYEWTRPKILAHQAESLRKAVFEVLPGAAGMRPLVERGGKWEIAAEVAAASSSGEGVATSDGQASSSNAAAGGTGESGSDTGSSEAKEAPPGERAFAAYDEAGELIGYAFEAEGGGFQDVIRLLYGFDPRARRIVGMRILESRETPGLGDRIYKDPNFVHGFDALAVDPEIVLVKGAGSGSPNEVHAITGATISSRAVVEILKTAQSRWEGEMPAVPGTATSGLTPTPAGTATSRAAVARAEGDAAGALLPSSAGAATEGSASPSAADAAEGSVPLQRSEEADVGS